ncbi:MAG: D-glycero-beta-D-manno-heptose 1-phosphate adenylyltransferase, partial [Planctomycetota bacterium]
IDEYRHACRAATIDDHAAHLLGARALVVVLDPAAIRDYAKYQGCSAITPNRTEGERATGLRSHDSDDDNGSVLIAHAIQSQLDCDAVVLTLDKQGALLLEQGTEPVVVPTVARQVYDVTGAGDMVLAALCAARANELSWHDAVRFANAAAGLEVEVFGVCPIPMERIHQSIIAQARKPHDKHRSINEAMIEVAAAHREGKSVVFTNGCFDVIHAGHIALLRRAKAAGDVLIVALNTDASVSRLKGPQRPVHPLNDRVEVLSELASVDLLLSFDEETPMRLIEALRPDVLVKGADYTRDTVVGADFVESYGGRIELIELLPDRSTSASIDKMRTA